MAGQKLFEKINGLQYIYIRVWEDVCNIESPTEYKPGADAVCAYVVDLAEAAKWLALIACFR